MFETIEEIKTTGKNIVDIYAGGGWPHPNLLYKYARMNPEFSKRLKGASRYKGIRKCK